MYTTFPLNFFWISFILFQGTPPPASSLLCLVKHFLRYQIIPKELKSCFFFIRIIAKKLELCLTRVKLNYIIINLWPFKKINSELPFKPIYLYIPMCRYIYIYIYSHPQTVLLYHKHYSVHIGQSSDIFLYQSIYMY